jgi:acetylornithine aminotransferase
LYPLPRLELVSGRGTRVTDAAGRTYLDFVSGIAVNAFGHTPPGLARAVAKQMRTLSHCSNLFAHRPGIELARMLTEATGYSHVFFCNSGTEATESAQSGARGGREGKDARLRGGFHGCTACAGEYPESALSRAVRAAGWASAR